MTKPALADDLRAKIIANPDFLLDDPDLMRALVGANDDAKGNNIVDLRAIAMDRLEARFDKLEDTHRNVIAAAYDNLAGTNQVHRAILRMMDAATFAGFLTDLAGDVANTLRVDAIRLVLEVNDPDHQSDLGPVVASVASGFVSDYITMARNLPARQVTLRKFTNVGASLYGENASEIRSEACLKLDLGTGRLPAMLVMGSKDAQLFSQSQGTDLMAFFTGVLERVLRRWLG
ncbi:MULTISPECIES: DUF484 family protein [unclassified Yoonia]|uniref:DUF484 family protein n=1 Tax=unclassified Yoonia TaxID=2629118 RepID=UPI002AFFF757|nr:MULTISPECIES: DUF484 family protein [unclassified Yoonia]